MNIMKYTQMFIDIKAISLVYNPNCNVQKQVGGNGQRPPSSVSNAIILSDERIK